VRLNRTCGPQARVCSSPCVRPWILQILFSLSLCFFFFLYLCGFVWASCGWLNVGTCGSPCCSDLNRKTKIQVLGKAEFTTFLFPLLFFFKNISCALLLAVTAVFCREMEVSRSNSILRKEFHCSSYTLITLFYCTWYNWFNGALLHSTRVELRQHSVIVLLYRTFR